ncbi:alanine racemase [Aurantiacibacter marinus]|uniref:alanine racemase n=1 Tax=Aurantiacibacter marinus TaxID=874156 RepID=A0A0H0XPE8_9SPHN|nr:alanine racemase [Aurantiacibacter marinus]KLI63871.1 alanine racemase [Aurantiacibacter marinus]
MTLPEEPPRSLRLRLDRMALAANWRALDRLSGEAMAGAAVKADAYGLGVDAVVPALCDAGSRHFFLAHWSEVAAVLEHVAGSAISVLHGVRNAEEAAFAQATGVIPTINSLRQAKLWTESGGGTCHLMVDTGINRLGMALAELGDPLVQSLDVDILMSHLASADEASPQNARQLGLFHQATQQVQAGRLSLANSAGIMLGTDYHFDLTRPGLALYGGIAHPGLAGHIAQVAYPQAAIIQTRQLTAGDSVGYNALWTARQPTRVGTVSIGYADGFLRTMGPGSALQHAGDLLPVLGRVSMDMIVVDLTGSDAEEGDFIDLPGDLPALAQSSGLSQYEILTLMGRRFDRG